MKFSLIIPYHGNICQLDRLLASVPLRSDLQVITINDEQRNGAGWARNQGLAQAIGEYIFFADSDDWFLPTINNVLDSITNDVADIIYFNATAKEESSGKPSWRTNRLNWMMKQSDSRRNFLLRHTFTEPWCHIIKRSFIEKNGIRFDETPILNDVTFITQAGYYAKNIAVYNIQAYCVCNRDGSTAKRRSNECLLAYTEVMAKVNFFNKTHSVSYYQARMMRPFYYSIIHGDIRLAKQCFHAIKQAGFTTLDFIKYAITYPIYLTCWIYRKKCHKRATK